LGVFACIAVVVGAFAVEPVADAIAAGELDTGVEGVVVDEVADDGVVLVEGAISLAVEVVVDVPDGTLAGSGLCACLAAPAAPREACEEPESSELARSCPCPCVTRFPLP
jgi:hypothetical protein